MLTPGRAKRREKTLCKGKYARSQVSKIKTTSGSVYRKTDIALAKTTLLKETSQGQNKSEKTETKNKLAKNEPHQQSRKQTLTN